MLESSRGHINVAYMQDSVEVLDAHGRKLPAITDQLKLSLVFKNSKEHLLYAVATVNRPCSFSGNCSGMVAKKMKNVPCCTPTDGLQHTKDRQGSSNCATKRPCLNLLKKWVRLKSVLKLSVKYFNLQPHYIQQIACCCRVNTHVWRCK